MSTKIHQLIITVEYNSPFAWLGSGHGDTWPPTRVGKARRDYGDQVAFLSGYNGQILSMIAQKRASS